MNKLITHAKSIRNSLDDALSCASRFIWDAHGGICIGDLHSGTCLPAGAELLNRSVLIRTRGQLASALAMIELDGVVRRMIVCPPDVADHHVPDLVKDAGVDAVIGDPENADSKPRSDVPHIPIASSILPGNPLKAKAVETEWVLLTSGTSAVPKMVAHTFGSLTAPIKKGLHHGSDVVWGTFYDIRRYGGLQIFLRAILGHGSLVLSDANEPPTEHLARLSAHRVTHLTGTPSHWRRALMSPAARTIAPRYIRLSGEISDQPILNLLHSFYPHAAIGHAFASTEAGVAFEVNDGREGFPETLLHSLPDVEIKVQDSSLRIRSNRTASRFIGQPEIAVKDSDGYVDTGDIVELRNGRYYFLGRRSGVVNVGGLKVYPEEIESILNKHPAVRMSCVRARRNPIMGALVVADIVLKDNEDSGKLNPAQIRDEILKECRNVLPRHKVPAAVNFVPSLGVAASGKISRSDA